MPEGRAPSRGRRRWLGLAIALAVGLLGAVLDTRPGFDDTGVLAVGLVGGGVMAGLASGTTAPVWILLMSLAAGLPVPIAELLTKGPSAEPFVAVAFGAVGVVAGAAMGRLTGPRSASEP